MGAVREAVEAELTELDATSSVEAQLALRLADQVDSPRAGMAVAQDARELRQVMAAIRNSSTQEGDSVDDSRGATLSILKSLG